MDGADGLADDAVAAVDQRDREQEGGGHFIDSDIMPSRWWFAASAFPMAAGTLGPVASAFSICALVRPWRQAIQPGQTIATASFIKDPVWLTTINAIQLAIALVANLFLLLNMARRIRFVVAQPVTMLGWFFSALTLIALTATASGPLLLQDDDDDTIKPGSTMVWSQAFFYAIYAAVLYMLVASLMAVTFAGARSGHYPKDFQLSNSQRTLMLQTIMVLMYLLVGAVVFSHLEGWAYLDAVYWADVTLFTVGFGDLAAESTAGRALLFPYALVGIISLGLVIGSIRSLALERGRRRLNARMTEKNRRKFLLSLAKQGKDGVLQPIQQQQSRSRASLRSSFSRPQTATATATGLTEYERREEEFKIMRRIQHNAATARRWLGMATSGGVWVALWLVGAWVFQACEQPYQRWSYFDGFYLSFVSLTTIGYGDVTPISNAGRSFFVFWSLLALPATTILISNAGDTIVKTISDVTNAVGRITILPGERGLKRDLKEMARMLTFGAIFDDDDDDDHDVVDHVDIEEAPPGLLGAAQQTEGERDEALAEDAARDDEEAEEAAEAVDEVEAENAEKGVGGGDGNGSGDGSDSYDTRKTAMADKQTSPPGYPLTAVPAVSMPRTDIPPDLPRTRAEYHCVLIDEIVRVTEHLRHTPPRKYTFQEWAWFLRLVGEDEHNAEHHRKVRVPQQPRRRRRMGSRGSDDDDNSSAAAPAAPAAATPGQWSWVGVRSPLMSSQEEAEWILDRLTKRLQAELTAAAKEADVNGSADAHDDADGPSKTGQPSGDAAAADPGPYRSRGQRVSHSITEEREC